MMNCIFHCLLDHGGHQRVANGITKPNRSFVAVGWGSNPVAKEQVGFEFRRILHSGRN